MEPVKSKMRAIPSQNGLRGLGRLTMRIFRLLLVGIGNLLITSPCYNPVLRS